MINVINKSNYFVSITNVKIVIKKIIEVLKESYSSANYLNEINLIFVSPSAIKKLNQNFLNLNSPTDVLTFPHIKDQVIQGDIAICPQEVIKNAKYYQKEIKYMFYETLLHACLHLVGLEHGYTKKSLSKVYALQENLLKKLSLNQKIIHEYPK